MAAYWSYGGGVNSTAGIILTLTDDRFAELRDGLRIVFADTGAEMPETLCYMRYFDKWLHERYGLRIEMVSAGSLIDYCNKYQIVPSWKHRWCTDRFKLTPLRKWEQANDITLCLVGIDAGEQHRANRIKAHKQVTMKRFPLIEADVDREGCEAIIRNAGLEMPEKSGCWICPYAPKRRWQDLRTHRPDLFEQACLMEESARNFAAGHYLKAKPLREWITQPGLDFGEPCNVCEVL